MSDSRRIADLETQVAELRRQILSIPKPGAISFPRERWLGRTVARSSSYPEPGDGNTFEVELISAAFLPKAPGNSATTIRPRGPVVVARTWPEQYLAENSYVIVDRLKGPDDGGEWWIAGGGSSQAETIRWAYLSRSYQTETGADTVSGSDWSYELLVTPGTPEGSLSGNAGRFVGGRLRIDIPGTYQAVAQSTVKCEIQSISGGGFSANDCNLKLWVLDENFSTGIQGHSQLKATGIASYVTTSASGLVTVESSQTFIPFFLNGRSYLPPYAMAVTSWSLMLVKLSD
jgi:hypothetical protein